MSDTDQQNAPDKAKPGFWESLSKEPPREGDKLKAVIFGIVVALSLFAIAWFMLHKNADPLA